MSIPNLKYPKVLASSFDPLKLSTTVKGVLAGLIPAFLMLAPFLGWTVGPDDFDQLLSSVDGFFNALQALIVAGTVLYSSVLVVFGLARKIAVGVGLVKPRR